MIEPSMENLMNYLSSFRQQKPGMMPPVQQPNPMEMLAMQAQQARPQQQNPLMQMLAQGNAIEAITGRGRQIDAQTAEPQSAPTPTSLGATQAPAVQPNFSRESEVLDRWIQEQAARRAQQAAPQIKIPGKPYKYTDSTGTPTEGFVTPDGTIYDNDPNEFPDAMIVGRVRGK